MPRWSTGIQLLIIVSVAACGAPTLPTEPSAEVLPHISLEAEAGSGDGSLVQRSRASGGYTIHLAPGEHRQWMLPPTARAAEYSLSVTYSNDNIGESEVVRLVIDGAPVGAFVARDTGDEGEGWNVFMADHAGTSILRAGNHTLALDVSGGDGCIEIDFVTLSPTAAAS